jgi:hypothetical protein
MEHGAAASTPTARTAATKEEGGEFVTNMMSAGQPGAAEACPFQGLRCLWGCVCSLDVDVDVVVRVRVARRAWAWA